MSLELLEHELNKQYKRAVAFEEYELMANAIESLDIDDYSYEEEIEDSEYIPQLN